MAEVFELCDEASGVGFVVAPGVPVGAEILIRLVSFQHPVSATKIEWATATCASTYSLPEWLRERRPDLVTPDQIARFQRVVDLLVVAGDVRVADLTD